MKKSTLILIGIIIIVIVGGYVVYTKAVPSSTKSTDNSLTNNPDAIKALASGKNQPAGCDVSSPLVCGKDGNTYRNSCDPLFKRTELDYVGPCKDRPAVLTQGDISTTSMKTLPAGFKNPGNCPLTISTVCDANTGRTYPNSCFAKYDNAIVSFEGACK